MEILVAIIMMNGWLAGEACAKDAPGASVFFINSGPIITKARKLVTDGRLEEADHILQALSAESHQPQARAAKEGREVIRRIRIQYDLDENGLLNRLATSIPNATAADIERWRRLGQVQWRMLDDEVHYFSREPSNIFRFCDEARSRREEQRARKETSKMDNEATSAPEQTLNDHLKCVIEAAKATQQVEVLPMQHRVRYRLTVLPDRPGARIGSKVRCWLPFPQVYRQQRNVELIHSRPAEHTLSPSAGECADSGGVWQRTIYLEQRIEDVSQPVVFEEELKYVSSAYYPVLAEALVRPLRTNFNQGCLDERLPHIIFTPAVRRVIKEIVGDETNPLKQARKLFQFVASEIRYCAEEEYSIIPSLSVKALQTRRGDCGAKSMLFITLCRAAGVPARWQSGWQTRPNAWNMHDWAEFYVEPWGWLPADASFGLRDAEDPDLRMFYFGHLDAYRMIVNLEYGVPLTPPKASLRSEPADFQRGEVEIDGRNLYFDEWDYDFECTIEPLKQ